MKPVSFNASGGGFFAVFGDVRKKRGGETCHVNRASKFRGDLKYELGAQNMGIVCDKFASFWRHRFTDSELELHPTVGSVDCTVTKRTFCSRDDNDSANIFMGKFIT
jgi:hypothetical protein